MHIWAGPKPSDDLIGLPGRTTKTPVSNFGEHIFAYQLLIPKFVLSRKGKNPQVETGFLFRNYSALTIILFGNSDGLATYRKYEVGESA